MAAAILVGAGLVAETGTAILTDATLTAGVRQSAFITQALIMDPSTVLSVEAGPALTDDPFDLITLSASTTGSPDSVDWSLVSATNSAAPVLIGTGATVTYYAPPTVNGCVLTWMVTATKAGNAPVTDTVVHTIRNHAGPWFVTGPGYLTGSGRTPAKISALMDVAVANSTYSALYTETY